VLAALRWVRMPALIVDILGMTYRYMFLLLHSANSMFLPGGAGLSAVFPAARTGAGWAGRWPLLW